MNIFDELKSDHREIKALLKELTWLERNDDYRFLLIAEIKNALFSHCKAEERTLYKKMKEKQILAPQDLLKGTREHLEMETIFLALQAADRVGANWKPLARKLKAVSDQHISREESSIFSAAQARIGVRESARLAKDFLRIKKRFRAKAGHRTPMEVLSNMFSGEGLIPNRMTFN